MKQEDKLKKAKELYKTANKDQKYVLEKLFPELKESKSKRIRKALIFHYQGDGCLSTNEYRIDYKDICAWLEKQGKEKSVEWSGDDKEHVNSLLKRLEGLCRNEFQKTRFAISEDIVWLESFKQRIGK